MSRNSENNLPEQETKITPERSKPPIKIGFGYVFKGENGSRFVILDVGRNNWFVAARVVTRMGQEEITIPGTSAKWNIDEMLGQDQRYSLEAVLKGVMAYSGDIEPRGKLYDKIRDAAKKKPRNLP